MSKPEDEGREPSTATDQPVAEPANEPLEPEDAEQRATRLMHEIAIALARSGPQGWQQLDALFVLTTEVEIAQVFFSDAEQRTERVQPSAQVLELLRAQRNVSAELGDGPWWRLQLSLAVSGAIEVDYDYGDEPFPDEQLFPPEVYRADLAVYPRNSLPVWLAAYIGHGDRQTRTPRTAAVQARADRAGAIRATVSDNDFPEFPLMWSRWSVLAAAFVAAGSQWGPRILPALGYFEGSKRSGSTLYALPGGRAVLSGGVWNAPELDAAYNTGSALPQLYSGAPAWVAGPVLNPRAANGLLSFCYWWENGRWYRAESPPADDLAAAVPGMWTRGTVTDVVCGLITADPTAEQRAAVQALVEAAEVGVVTHDTVAAAFGDPDVFDIDSAFYQLTMAGLTLSLPDPIPSAEALDQVRRFISAQGADTSGYPLDQLRADRLGVGWMIYVPTRPGEVSIGRAIFYVADDGVLEQSSSSVPPSQYIPEFEQRFRTRHRNPSQR
ncbi:hypothetical protein [Nocardia huaxiensis]|uniref:hypothetical protein n=1 Tax=Nocardia huaxiensis TaxID=2755382 RepID=UPI001E4CF9C7|nr:hypothetical protein [Nocardia huaxiensis]UFS95416.1 hypothetical protein LPY97_32830 [Nocardia huaxiensis]